MPKPVLVISEPDTVQVRGGAYHNGLYNWHLAVYHLDNTRVLTYPEEYRGFRLIRW